MAKENKPKQDPTAVEAEPPKKKRGKLVLIAGVLVVVLAGAGGGGWYFMQPADPHAVKKVEKPKPPIFLPLESFTVNLLPSEGQPQFVQAGLTLKLEDSAAADLIKERMPQVRDRVLMVLSSKRSAELLPTQGKQKLAGEISSAVRNVIAPATPPAPPPAKAGAAEVSPVASAQAAAAPAAAADKRAEVKAADAKPVPQGPVIEVLFTSFIIQ